MKKTLSAIVAATILSMPSNIQAADLSAMVKPYQTEQGDFKEKKLLTRYVYIGGNMQFYNERYEIGPDMDIIEQRIIGERPLVDLTGAIILPISPNPAAYCLQPKDAQGVSCWYDPELDGINGNEISQSQMPKPEQKPAGEEL